MKPRASSVRQRFVVLRIAPGVDVLVALRLSVGQIFPDEPRVLRPALLTSGLRGGEGRLLAAPALDHDGLGLPRVDLAVLHLFDLVTRTGTVRYLRH
jgi:hypothetical protein